MKVGQNIVTTVFQLPVANIHESEAILSKLTARAIIKELEVNPRSVGESRQNQAEKIPLKRKPMVDKMTQISLMYGVLSKYVSLLAVEKRSDND